LHCLKNFHTKENIETKFVKYSQSPVIREKNENGISFAAAISYFINNE
jgi:hypothetical protein